MRIRAFSFVELLVALAIVSLLTATLLAVFTRAREQSTLSTCVNHSERLGTALRMYMLDTDEVLPHWCDVSGKTWDVYLLPLVKSAEPFACPSKFYAGAQQSAGAGRPMRAYSLPRNVSGMPVWRMKVPARTVLLYEIGRGRLGDTSGATGEWFGQSLSGATDVRFQQADPNKWPMPHGNGKVFLFVDGHARWHKAILSGSTENPFGYAFGPFPGTLSGQFRLGYCGDLDSPMPSTGGRSGANLPR